MAKKRNTHKKGLDHTAREEVLSGNVKLDGRFNNTKSPSDHKRNNTISNKDKRDSVIMSGSPHPECIPSSASDDLIDNSTSDSSRLRNGQDSSTSFENGFNVVSDLHNVEVKRGFIDSILSWLKVIGEWLKKQKPLFDLLLKIIVDASNFVRLKYGQFYPIILKWLGNCGKLAMILFMVWLHCSLRGIDSLLRLGTTSFFTVIWCSILSIVAMVGILKFLIAMVTIVAVTIFAGLILGIFLSTIIAFIFLWMYGNFWTTMSITAIGGAFFALKHERLALLVTTMYSLYCAKVYVGWSGLLLGANLSFISSDVLIYFLRSHMDDERNNPDHLRQNHDTPENFHSDPIYTSNLEERSPGVPSTSGNDIELTAEEEVIRLLNCNDHYSALGLVRYQDVDVSMIKKEYRRKAMLVHPDKNMGDEKSEEAFKKLQNAYEVLLDSLKRKAYDDELRKDELLNYLRRLQSSTGKNGRNGIFSSAFGHTEGTNSDSRRIVCKRCGNFHVWAHTDKTKSRARWCQDCKDFHQAKDGDGWVEQSFHPFLFGLLQKVGEPIAYVCAESKIYNATEWFICQGMRCPTNTHKPSFHINTNLTSKHNSNTRGSGSAHRGGLPTANIDQNMTEEEFFEWLQNAVQSGMFEPGSPSTETPTNKNSSGSKTGGGDKRKKGRRPR